MSVEFCVVKIFLMFLPRVPSSIATILLQITFQVSGVTVYIVIIETAPPLLSVQKRTFSLCYLLLALASCVSASLHWCRSDTIFYYCLKVFNKLSCGCWGQTAAEVCWNIYTLTNFEDTRNYPTAGNSGSVLYTNANIIILTYIRCITCHWIGFVQHSVACHCRVKLCINLYTADLFVVAS
jgi:hypothetical protein